MSNSLFISQRGTQQGFCLTVMITSLELTRCVITSTINVLLIRLTPEMDRCGAETSARAESGDSGEDAGSSAVSTQVMLQIAPPVRDPPSVHPQSLRSVPGCLYINYQVLADAGNLLFFLLVWCLGPKHTNDALLEMNSGLNISSV